MILDLPVGRLISFPGGGRCLVAVAPAKLFFVAADAGGDQGGGQSRRFTF
jgi:hypothetical protein